jgi:NAD(P)-dependent dehydrogenase (short-subunit alcohol dehydrogenase family)
MSKRILIIGGYGNFGAFIARNLVAEPGLKIIIAGRSAEKASLFAYTIGAEWAVLDINHDLDAALHTIRPDIVIHTSGPFQGQGYDVAIACLRHQCHYIDLADGREFVCHIDRLDTAAKDAGVLVVSGASSVPCLTSAIIDACQHEFQSVDTIDYAISTAQHTNPGVATTAAILGYTGKVFLTQKEGKPHGVYGWQGLTARRYPGIGWRLLANCDVPDLTLFPVRYPTIKTIRFRAGLEVPLLHLGLWGLSWLVRARLIKTLQPMASLFYRIAPLFNIFGTGRSAFHMEIIGVGADGDAKRKIFYIVTDAGHGINIPCVPAILLAKKLARGQITQTGAMPCMGLITLSEYLDALKQFKISWQWGDSIVS